MDKYEAYKEDRLSKLGKLPKKLQDIVKQMLEDMFRQNYIYTYAVENTFRKNNMLEAFGKDEKEYKEIIEFLFSKEHLKFYDYIRENGSKFAYTSGYYRRSYRDLSVNGKTNEMIVSLAGLLDSIFQLEDGANLGQKMPETDEEYYFILNKSSLFAAYLIDSGDKKIIELIKETILSEKNTQVVNYSLIRAVMYSNNKELVELLGNLLIAAQRQEGLRQSIVENADCGRVENFIYFIKLIIDNDLMRFNSVIRSMAVWANMTNLDTMRPKLVEKVVDTMYNALLDEKTREKYLDSEDKTEIYLSLWAEATHDVSKIDGKVEYLMSKKEDYKTVTATCFLNTITREKVRDATISKILMETDNYEVIAWVSVILGLRFNYSLGYEIVKKLEPIQVRPDNDTKLSKELAQAVFEKYQILFDKIKGKSGTIEILDSGVEGNILTIYKESLEEGMFIAASELNDDKKIEELMSFVSSGKVKKAYLNNYVYKLRNEKDRAFLIECIGNGRDNNLQK